jgi:hypothetical protein
MITCLEWTITHLYLSHQEKRRKEKEREEKNRELFFLTADTGELVVVILVRAASISLHRLLERTRVILMYYVVWVSSLGRLKI